MMVTPIHDPQWRKWYARSYSFSSMVNFVERESETMGNHADPFRDYNAPGFMTYTERGWCRLEMFFNTNVPVNTAREKLFGGKLREAMAKEKRRPHLVYGTREMERGDMPVILRPLRDDEFMAYHPGQGGLTDKRDALVINAYVQELCRINSKLQVCDSPFLR